MKKGLLTAAFIMLGTLSTIAQTDILVTYDGGYFIKSNDTWEEYRPHDKSGVWASYKQESENYSFYYISNKHCKLAIPKNENNYIYIEAEKENNNGLKDKIWNIVYDTKKIYTYYPGGNKLLYCYNEGYFTRDNDAWREYRPNKKKSLWAEFKQVEEQENYFIIESTKDKVAIPKEPANSFYIKKNNKWELLYSTSAIYDVSAEYNYNFYFKNHSRADENGKMHEAGSCARLSFNRYGDAQIVYGEKFHDITFKEISTLRYMDDEIPIGIEFTIDENSKIQLILHNICIVDIKKLCPYINLTDCTTDNKMKDIMELIENNAFFIE